jgi:hypothetical protein
MKMLKAQFKTSLTTEKHEPIATDTIQWQCGAKRAQKNVPLSVAAPLFLW